MRPLLLLLLAGCAPSVAATPSFQDLTPVRFVAVGDAGKGNADQATTAEAMAAVCAEQGCDFAMLLGDNLYPTGASSTTDPLWQTAFEAPFAALDLPFYPVLGNHDLGLRGLESWRGDVQVAYSQVSPRWRMPARYHRHELGPVEFLALDTPTMMFDGLGGPLQRAFSDRVDEQLRWLDGATSRPAAWRIAYGHHPLRSNGQHGDAGLYERLPVVPVLAGGGVRDALEDHVCGRVDLYLAAHDHNQQWLAETCDGTELIVSGAGANTVPLRGSHPVRFQDDSLEGFVWIEVRGATLRVQFWNRDGELLHEGSVSKGPS